MLLQRAFHFPNKRGDADRLDKITIDARSESTLPFRQQSVRGESENRGARGTWVTLEQTGGIDAVHVGKADVHEHQIGRRLSHSRDGGLGTRELLHDKAVRAEHRAVYDPIVFVVLDNENGSRFSFILHGRSIRIVQPARNRHTAASTVTIITAVFPVLPSARHQDRRVAISDKLHLRVAQRLGLSARLTTDIKGLYELYGAWCRHVPFDNVRKLIALRTGDSGPLPGSDATDFFEKFLENGTGGTCWSSSNALFELVTAFGFTARRVAGSMRDLGVPGHGSVKVTINEQDWLVDSSMLSMFPIPMMSELYVYRDPLFGVEVEPSGGSHVVWFNTPPYDDYFPCRFLIDNVTLDFYMERYEISRTRGPFNHHVSVRYNRDGARNVLQGPVRHRVTEAEGLVSTPLDRPAMLRELREVVGMSASVVDAWARCGALDAQYETPENPPAALTVKPPSTRNTPS